MHMCEMSQKGPHVRGGRTYIFRVFFLKFSKMKQTIIIFLQDS